MMAANSRMSSSSSTSKSISFPPWESASGSESTARGGRIRKGLRGGQEDAEYAALAHGAFHFDKAADLLDDSKYRGQSEAGSLALGLGREKWLENSGDGCSVHTAAGIAHGNLHPIFPDGDPVAQRRFRGNFGVAGGDGQNSIAFHGVPRIDRQVDNDLLNLVGVGFDQAKIVRKIHPQIDIDSEKAIQHFPGLTGSFIEIDRLQRQNLVPAKGQHLPGQSRRAFACLLDRL